MGASRGEGFSLATLGEGWALCAPRDSRSLRSRAHWRLRRRVSRTGIESRTSPAPKNDGPQKGAFCFLVAEREGFEPSKGF